MSVYTPESILLTGGAGFIGSHVLDLLVTKYPKCKVVCLDKLDYCSNVRNFEHLLECDNFTFVKGDILSADLVNFLVLSHKVDTIMHFAAQSHVDNSFGNSIEFTKANVVGTHVLLESAKLHQQQIRRFIHVSTDEVYGESLEEAQDKDRKQETSALNPTNPYAATKCAAEFLVKSYRKSFNLPTIITRGNNVYGPNQFPEKLIPKFINLLSRGKPCCLHGDGSNQRSFLYVSDVADAFDTILQKGQPGQIYNIGTDYEISNLEVARSLLKEFGHEKEEDKYITYVRDRAFNDFRYHIDTSDLEKLGWTRKVKFDEGLKKTKDWYLSHKDWWGDISSALVAHPTVKQGVSTSTPKSNKRQKTK
jgi:UDP-glucose 4,6-dehydratase